jgi:hypothetical protein
VRFGSRASGVSGSKNGGCIFLTGGPVSRHTWTGRSRSPVSKASISRSWSRQLPVPFFNVPPAGEIAQLLLHRRDDALEVGVRHLDKDAVEEDIC